MNSTSLFYGAVAGSIAYGQVDGSLMAVDSKFMVMVLLVSSAFGIVIDIVLLIVVLSGEKEAFNKGIRGTGVDSHKQRRKPIG